MKSIDKITWLDIKDQVNDLNHDFYDAVESSGNVDKLGVYKLRYRFGDNVLKDGRFMLPVDALNDKEAQNFLKEVTYTAGMPLGMVLEKSLELYFDVDQRTYPVLIFKRGDLFATSSIIRKQFKIKHRNFWQASSGARTLFCTSKLSNQREINRISRVYNNAFICPKNYSEHQQLFTEVSRISTSEWSLEILVFTDEWVKHIDSIKFSSMRSYLFEYAWNNMAYWREAFIYDHEISLLASYVNVPKNTFIQGIAKYILLAGVGQLLSFKVSTDSEMLPLETINNMLISYLEPLSHFPVIVEPAYATTDTLHYYSFAQHISDLNFESKNKGSRRVADIEEILRFIELMKWAGVEKKRALDEGGLIYQALHVDYAGYHNSESKKLASAASLLEADKKLKTLSQIASTTQATINTKSPFFSGVIAF